MRFAETIYWFPLLSNQPIPIKYKKADQNKTSGTFQSNIPCGLCYHWRFTVNLELTWRGTIGRKRYLAKLAEFTFFGNQWVVKKGISYDLSVFSCLFTTHLNGGETRIINDFVRVPSHWALNYTVGFSNAKKDVKLPHVRWYWCCP